MSSEIVPKKQKKRPLLKAFVLLLILAICGVGGYILWKTLSHERDLKSDLLAEAKTEVDTPPAAPLFFSIEPLTVNLVTEDNNLDTVLHVGLTLRLPDEATRSLLQEFLPEVRSRILVLLSQQEANDLMSEQGKVKLVEKIKETLAQPFAEGHSKQVISDVLFTTFVLR